jgi:formate hydrogenlyase subunit 6/NADH:ubiquinone oxidoreductase subunit I
MPSAAAGYLMLDPGHCILCGVCEQACPWDCIHAVPSGLRDEGDGLREADARAPDGYTVFVVDDDVCPRCSVCIDRCPTHTLYYARLPEDTAGTRTLATVPASRRPEVAQGQHGGGG